MAKKTHKLIKIKKHSDRILLFLVFVLSIFGLIMVYDSSIVEASEQFADKFHYLKYQSVAFLFGWIVSLFLARVDYHLYKKIIKILFYVNIIALLLVFTPIGMEIKGARRWLDLGFTSFQPSETLKTILVLYLATWLEKPRRLIHFFALIIIVLFLIIFEPDLGTAIVIVATSFVIFFVSGAEIFRFALASFATFLLGLILILTSPYRRERLTTFLNPSSSGEASSYHIDQITISLGSGGLTGVGLGNSKQKYQYLPEATTDSIFAIVGEEMGFIGSVALILIFLAIIWRGLQIAQKAPDNYGRLIAIGITTWIGTQAFVNLASMASIVPLTGIPLPFLSYGGTSLSVSLASIGILLNVSRHRLDS